jgi:hypothetical protein
VKVAEQSVPALLHQYLNNVLDWYNITNCVKFV